MGSVGEVDWGRSLRGVDLFETMDVNGQQSVSWECFSLYFVSAYSSMQVCLHRAEGR